MPRENTMPQDSKWIVLVVQHEPPIEEVFMLNTSDVYQFVDHLLRERGDFVQRLVCFRPSDPYRTFTPKVPE